MDYEEIRLVGNLLLLSVLIFVATYLLLTDKWLESLRDKGVSGVRSVKSLMKYLYGILALLVMFTLVFLIFSFLFFSLWTLVYLLFSAGALYLVSVITLKIRKDI